MRPWHQFLEHRTILASSPQASPLHRQFANGNERHEQLASSIASARWVDADPTCEEHLAWFEHPSFPVRSTASALIPTAGGCLERHRSAGVSFSSRMGIRRARHDNRQSTMYATWMLRSPTRYVS